MPFPVFNITKKKTETVACEGIWGEADDLFTGPKYNYTVVRSHTWEGDTYKITPPAGSYTFDFTWDLLGSLENKAATGINLLLPESCRTTRGNGDIIRISIRAFAFTNRYQVQCGTTNLTIVDTNVNNVNAHRFGKDVPLGTYEEVYWDVLFNDLGTGDVINGRQNFFNGDLQVDWWKIENLGS